MSESGYTGGVIKRRSGWLIPLAVFVVTAVLSLFVLIYYLAPPPAALIQDRPSPTGLRDPVTLQIGSTRLTIPANYILYASARRGGERSEVALAAELPDWQGYSPERAPIFSGNAADSPVIYLLIRNEPLSLTETERLERIYLSYVTNPAGEPGPFGLTHYIFRDDSGYRDEDLFVGQSDDAPVVLRCVRLSNRVPSPTCLRDQQLQHGLALSYRFKRAHLAEWKEIARGADRLVSGFGAK
jgi:hypothetical protein